MWAALLLAPALSAPSSSTRTESRLDPLLAHSLQGVALWALQFTPRVALLEEAVVLEVEMSVRLFGGLQALRDRVRVGSQELGVQALAWSPTSLAALALGRNGIEDGFKRPLAQLLDALPMESLSAVRPHLPTLARLGCKSLGDVRALPRGGISRRFDKELLAALDQAYGLRPEAHAWVVLPETFNSRLELMARVELAPALLFGARRLLVQLCGWLAARHCGITAFTLRWRHDAMRARSAGDGGEITVRTAEPMRDCEHLCRLLAEHLAHVGLLAPVGDLELHADEVRSLKETSGSLLPGTVRQGESLQLVLERIAARLGPEHVLRPVVLEDHRLEWMQQWQPASLAPSSSPFKPTRTVDIPQPTWLLPAPLRLVTRGPHPLYQGVLQLLTGPHRIEGGWWHRVQGAEAATGAQTFNVQRDYWVALSEHAGVLWVFQERFANDQTAWYLHGTFA